MNLISFLNKKISMTDISFPFKGQIYGKSKILHGVKMQIIFVKKLQKAVRWMILYNWGLGSSSV